MKTNSARPAVLRKISLKSYLMFKKPHDSDCIRLYIANHTRKRYRSIVAQIYYFGGPARVRLTRQIDRPDATLEHSRDTYLTGFLFHRAQLPRVPAFSAVRRGLVILKRIVIVNFFSINNITETGAVDEIKSLKLKASIKICKQRVDAILSFYLEVQYKFISNAL